MRSPYDLIHQLRWSGVEFTDRELDLVVTVARTAPVGATRADLAARVRVALGCDAARADRFVAVLVVLLASEQTSGIRSTTARSRRLLGGTKRARHI